MFFGSRSDTMPGSVEIEIFKPGKHRAMNGKQYAFSQADAEAIATAFDPQNAPVPIVIGHPKHDAPAYAWAETVYMDGNIMKARLKDVDPDFAEIVRAGRYKNISSSFYAPDSPSNPIPGQYYLRHIGFLGAAAPAVKGLKPVEFTSDEQDYLAFGAVDAEAMAAQYEREMRGLKTGHKVEELISQGKVLPWARDGLLEFMEGLDDSELVAFAEGEEMTQADWFLDYLSKQPEVVPMDETDMSDDPGTSSPSFTAPEGYAVDPDALNTHNRAIEIQQERNISYLEALDLADHGH